MAYAKTTWVNDTTPIEENALNNIENGIETLDTEIGNLNNLETQTTNTIVNAINEVNSNSQIYYRGTLKNINSLQIDIINTSITASNTNLNNQAISFNKSFSSAPYVIVGIRGSAGYCDHFGCNNITTTGCNIQYKHNNTGGAVYYTVLVIGDK